MLAIQFQPTIENSQLLYDVCQTVLGRRPGYLKGLGWWDPRPKSRHVADSSFSVV